MLDYFQTQSILSDAVLITCSHHSRGGYMKLILMIFTAVVLLPILGCSSTEVLEGSEERRVGSFALISSPLDYQHHVVNTAKPSHQICQSPPSNGFIGASDSLGLSAKGDSASASDAVTDSMSARGDASYIASDLLYRVCEFIQNSSLSQKEATRIFENSVKQVGAIGIAAASKPSNSDSDDDDDDDDSDD